MEVVLTSWNMPPLAAALGVAITSFITSFIDWVPRNTRNSAGPPGAAPSTPGGRVPRARYHCASWVPLCGSCCLNHTSDDCTSSVDTPAAMASGVVAQYARLVRREASSTRPNSEGGTTSRALRRSERATDSPAAVASCDRATAGT